MNIEEIKVGNWIFGFLRDEQAPFHGEVIEIYPERGIIRFDSQGELKDVTPEEVYEITDPPDMSRLKPVPA